MQRQPGMLLQLLQHGEKIPRHRMMDTRMETMQSMMKMMIDRMPAEPTK